MDQLDPKDEKSLPLTWEQLETFGTATGRKIELRYISQCSSLPSILIALCKDRANVSMRVEMARNIPNFQPGTVIVWKNPRFHRFTDGSGGARIEESDLSNIKIKPSE